MTLAVHLIAEAEDYINWAFSLKGNRIEMVRNDCIYKFWQWNQYNELLKKIDGEKYKESNRQFEEKYALFAPTMNYKTKTEEEYEIKNNETERDRNSI